MRLLGLIRSVVGRRRSGVRGWCTCKIVQVASTYSYLTALCGGFNPPHVADVKYTRYQGNNRLKLMRLNSSPAAQNYVTPAPNTQR